MCRGHAMPRPDKLTYIAPNPLNHFV
jgi:hypothetical protein